MHVFQKNEIIIFDECSNMKPNLQHTTADNSNKYVRAVLSIESIPVST